MPVPIEQSSAGVDLSVRRAIKTVSGGTSPSGASETIIATLTIPNFGNIPIVTGVELNGWAAYTLGSTPTSCQLQIRQTNVSGAVVGNTGAMTGGHNTAGFLVSDDVNGFDAGAGVATYVLTLTVAGAGSASTVSTCFLGATLL
jgi:hypothetical protein